MSPRLDMGCLDIPLRRMPASSKDPTLRRDRTGSRNIVASAHLDGTSCKVKSGNRLMDTLAKRVFNTGTADERQFLREVLAWGIARSIFGAAGGGPIFEVAVPEGNGTEGLVGVEDDGAADVLIGKFIDFPRMYAH